MKQEGIALVEDGVIMGVVCVNALEASMELLVISNLSLTNIVDFLQ